MHKRTIQFVGTAILAQSVLLSKATLAQNAVESSALNQNGNEVIAAQETSESQDNALMSIRELLKRSVDPVLVEQARTLFNIADVDLQSHKSRLGPRDPVRKRKGGVWSFDERWSIGLGMMRAGEPKPDDDLRSSVISKNSLMQVDGTDGSVHVLDAGINWNLEPIDDVLFSFEGGVRSLAQSDPVASEGVDLSATDLDGGLVTQPVMGAAVRWAVSDWAYIEGRATGNMMEYAGSYLDLTAQAGVDITSSTGLIAGYRFLDASFDDASGNSATVSQDALFAGLQIRY